MVRRSLLIGLLLGAGAFGAALALAAGGALQSFEAATWRWRVGHFARGPQGTTPIVIIALDQQSLDWGRRENGLAWPWPREAYVPLLDFCRRSGVRAVAFDVLFSEPSLYGVEDDRAFAAALRQSPPNVGSATLGPAAPQPAAAARRTEPVQLPQPPIPAADDGAVWPVPELAAAFARLGDVGGRPDTDGIFRRIALLRGAGGSELATLALVLRLAETPEDVTLVPDGVRIGTRTVPLDEEGLALLNFRGVSGTFPTYSAAAVIQSELRLQSGERPSLDPERLRGAYVFFGMTAPGLYDLRPTPIDGVFPGVEIHATALDNLLAGDFLRELPRPALLLGTLLLVLLSALAIAACRDARQSLLAVAILLPLPLLAGFYAYAEGYRLPVALPATASGLALLAGIVYNYATEGRKKREIRRAFNQYLHPTVIEELVKNPEKLRLGGEKRELTIFFSDLQGFTTLSENLDPEALTALLNEYLTAMTDLILDSGGTIDKYEGDAIIAFWNAPVDQPDHAVRAVRAALACQQRLAELRPHFAARVGRELHMRIGLNTGPAVVGNLGSARRFDYTMLGDAVNLAARLEGVNKEFGTYSLLSQMTCERLGGTIPLREIGRVAVVGRREPVTIFEPLATGAIGEAQQHFAAALADYYRGDFKSAAEAFAALAADDPPAARYLERCRQLSADPPVNWDGVWQMQSK